MQQKFFFNCVECTETFQKKMAENGYHFLLLAEGIWNYSSKDEHTQYKSGHLLFLGTNQRFSLTPLSESALCYVFYIDKASFKKYCKVHAEDYRDIDKTSFRSVLLTNSQSGYLSYLLSQLMHTDALHANAVVKHFLSNALFACFITNWNSFGDTYSVYPLDIIRRMDSYLDLDIDVADIYNHYPISQTSLVNEFKQLSGGYTIVQYRNIKRMEYAAILLTERDYSVTEVSNTLNISSLSYFSEQFKKAHGMTPSQYQAAHKGTLKKRDNRQ